MQSRRFDHPIIRGAAAALVGLVSLLAACESRIPTATDIARMDAASVERATPAIGMMQDSSVAWVVDGRPSTPAAAKQIPAGDIVSVQVRKANGHGEIHVLTKRGQSANVDVVFSKRVADVSAQPIETTGVKLLPKQAGAEPLLIIDGMPSTTAELRKLSADRIASVEVVKGESALTRYGESGRNGVILVTTKSR